jgi:hypothetical protein
LSYRDEHNIEHKFILRQNRYDSADPGVFIELRRVITALGYVHKAGPTRIIGQTLGKWVEDMSKFNLPVVDNFHHTVRSAPHWGVPKEKTVAQLECSFSFLIAVLQMHHNHRVDKFSTNSHAVFMAMMKDCVTTPSVVTDMLRPSCPDTFLMLCDKNTQQDKCECVRAAELSIGTTTNVLPDPFEKLKAVLSELTTFTDPCEAILEWLRACVALIATELESDHWHSTFELDFLGRAEDLVLMGASGKRRRMDMQSKVAIVQDAITTNRAPTTAAYLRAHPTLFKNSSVQGNILDKNFCGWVVTKAWESFAGTKHLSLSMDMIRSGMPATDDLIVEAEALDKRVSTWLPPNDRRVFSI